MKEILLNIESKETRLAKLNNRKLSELTVERKKSRLITGNIYRGKVTNILRNIQSAFIDIGEGENGFIHISDILENAQKFQEMFDMDFDWGYEEKASTTKKKDESDITKLLKVDQSVLVQVVKEPIGTKGARLTSNISIPGRYLVLLPNSIHRGVSKKISDKSSRERLKKIIKAFEMPADMGLICRTASIYASTDQLIDEAHELLKIWDTIVEKFQNERKSTCLFRESDIIKRALMTAIDKNYQRLLVDHYPTYLTLNRMFNLYKEGSSLKLEFYRDNLPMFERFNIEREIDKALRRKIWLTSGGYLFFDRTEAMYTVDVNSGRSSQSAGKSDVEETLVQINMEAAEEIARQLRVRNIGGLIICDFIDMRARKNQRRVLDHLKEAMKEDSAKCTILGMSEFGLIEMTRQRSRESLVQTLTTGCPYCGGRGVIKNHESIAIEIERAINRLINHEKQFALSLTIHPDLNKYLDQSDKKHYLKVATKLNARIEFKIDDTMHLNDYEFHSLTNGQRLEF